MVIIYDLRCRENHIFEGWFKDISAFEEQLEKKLVTCPVCGDSQVELIPTSFIKRGKDIQDKAFEKPQEISPMKALQLFHDYLGKNFEDVGDRFAEVALKIHEGEEDQRNIKGTTTPQEEDILQEKGIQFIKIPIPKFDS